jgi:hypothetical protein
MAPLPILPTSTNRETLSTEIIGEKGSGVSVLVGCGVEVGVMVGMNGVGDGEAVGWAVVGTGEIVGLGVSWDGAQEARVRQKTNE